MSAKKARKPKLKRMSKRQYIQALDELGLTVASQQTAEALRIGLRQCQRLAGGDARIPGPVERLLELYKKYPEELPPPLEER